MIADSKEDKRKQLILQCRYYRGEANEPKSLLHSDALYWEYESVWVRDMLKGGKLSKSYQEEAEFTRLETKKGDSTPLSLKALLFNRYMYWSSYSLASFDDLKKGFESWYVHSYQKCDTIGNRLKQKKPIFGISRHRMGQDGKGVTTLVTFMGYPLNCEYCINDQCHGSIYEKDGKTLLPGIRMLTVQEFYDIVKQDNIYFQVTGGGICFGGGEPTLNAEYISNFARLCEGRWRITIETSLCCQEDDIKLLAPCIDEWIVDIKDMNDDIYERYTGSHSTIHESLKMLKQLVPEEKITIKVPLIPDFNTQRNTFTSVYELKEMGFKNIVETKYIKTQKHITE